MASVDRKTAHAWFARTALILTSLMMCGPVFAGSQSTEKILYGFGPPPDGMGPGGGLVMDSAGNLYGTTSFGGNNGVSDPAGTVFKVTPAGEESILWNFGVSTDGQIPEAGVIIDASGNLFGTTLSGGLYDTPPDLGGTVFELNSAGHESVLWNFGNGTDGQQPEAGLITDASGNLFGTTAGGGIYNLNFNGSGTVFELTAAGQESVLWNFGNGSDGIGPSSNLIMDTNGNLYGTTLAGGTFGAGSKSLNGGTVFKLTPPAAAPVGAAINPTWTETILWNFGNGTDGQNPGSVIMDASGNLFGTTGAGGLYRGGTAFELSPSGQETILWNFGNGADGQSPGGIIMDASGSLFGTTGFGGIYTACSRLFQGCGTAFKLSPPSAPGGAWTETILWNFGNGSDGFGPSSSLIMDTNGNLFGETAFGGPGGADAGTVFELSNLNTASGQILLKTPNIAFPNTAAGKTSSYKLAIRNTGTAQLTGTVAPPPAPFGLNGSGSFKLAPRTETTVTLTFAPTLDARAHRPDTITSNSAQHSTVTLDLRGTGTAPNAASPLALNSR